MRVPNITMPAFGDSRAWGAVISISLIAIATIPESTAHLYQISLYVDQLAEKMGREKYGLDKLVGLNLVLDGLGDLIRTGPTNTNVNDLTNSSQLQSNEASGVVQ